MDIQRNCLIHCECHSDSSLNELEKDESPMRKTREVLYLNDWQQCRKLWSEKSYLHVIYPYKRNIDSSGGWGPFNIKKRKKHQIVNTQPYEIKGTYLVDYPLLMEWILNNLLFKDKKLIHTLCSSINSQRQRKNMASKRLVCM